MILKLFFISLLSLAKPIKVAVIDSGLDITRGPIPLCKRGHKDFTGTNLDDDIGHGTNVSHLINQNVKSKEYCQMILKIFTKKQSPYLAQAIRYAANHNADIINISAGGIGETLDEKEAVKDALDKGIIIVAAAGNESLNLDMGCDYYPACYDKRIIVVANQHHTSSYGKKYVDLTINGNLKTGGGYTMSGTSQSTAIATGQIISKMRGVNNMEKRAIEKSIKAFLIQSGIQKNVTKFIDKQRNLYINKDINEFVDKNFWLYYLVVEQRFEYNYDFP